MAEGARLESVFRGNSNLGSNPSLSAIRISSFRELPLPENYHKSSKREPFERTDFSSVYQSRVALFPTPLQHPQSILRLRALFLASISFFRFSKLMRCANVMRLDLIRSLNRSLLFLHASLQVVVPVFLSPGPMPV